MAENGIMRWLAVAAALTLSPAAAMAAPDGNVVLVTIDGVRWHEIFEGASPAMIANKRYVDPDVRHDVLAPAFVDVHDRAAALMPFLHSVVAAEGVLYGDRRAGQCARVSNPFAVSYPGYNEFLTGKADPAITGNDPVDNPNISFLEHLAHRPGFAGSVGVAANWDIFPAILNVKRSGLAVNAGLGGQYPSDVRVEREAFRLLDAHKRVVYLALGETDEFAHAGDYAHVLLALERIDDTLRRIWAKIEADPFYRGRTTLFVTTDHGRGDAGGDDWREHGTKVYYQTHPDDDPPYNAFGVPGSVDVWFAAIGPAVDRSAPMPTTCAISAQIAASALAAVGENRHAATAGMAEPFWFIRQQSD